MTADALTPVPGSDEHLRAILADVAVLGTEETSYGAERTVALPAAEDSDLADELHDWAAARQLHFVAEGALGVLAEVAAERHRQDVIWGEQNHPDGTDRFWPAIFCQSFADSREIARLQVDHEAKTGASNWTSILLEEVFEAIAEDDPQRLRAELVQVAAVAVQWAQAIDRRTGAR